MEITQQEIEKVIRDNPGLSAQEYYEILGTMIPDENCSCHISPPCNNCMERTLPDEEELIRIMDLVNTVKEDEDKLYRTDPIRFNVPMTDWDNCTNTTNTFDLLVYISLALSLISLVVGILCFYNNVK